MNIQDLGLLMVSKSGIKFTWQESSGLPGECYIIYVSKYKMKMLQDQNHSYTDYVCAK